MDIQYDMYMLFKKSISLEKILLNEQFLAGVKG